EAGEIFPFVATLMGLRVTGAHAERIAGIEGEALETLISHSIRELLRRMAALRPLIPVFEGGHWARLSSLKLREFLLGLVPRTPVLFLLVLRSAHAPTSQRLLRFVRERWPRRLVEVELPPLDATECGALIANLLDVEDLPYSTRAMIGR